MGVTTGELTSSKGTFGDDNESEKFKTVHNHVRDRNREVARDRATVFL